MGARKLLSMPAAVLVVTLVLARAALAGETAAGAAQPAVPSAGDARAAGAADNAAPEPAGPPGTDNAAGLAGTAGGNGPAVTAPGAAADNTALPAAAGSDNVAAAPEGPAEGPGLEEEAPQSPPVAIADPLERVNRAFFAFNDKAYFWVLKPVARGYNAVVPQMWRVSVRDFFSNLATPVRFVNNLLQGKIRGAGTELLRLGINSTIGMGGLFDPATTGFHIAKRDEDFGQTLGRYGLGGGFYIVWPLLGPSTARDTVGMAGDGFLDPINYLSDPWAVVAVKAYKTENNVSLSLGDYEALTESALDPYVAVRDAYVQNRARKVRE